MRKKIFSSLIVCLSVSSLYAQSNIDSLIKVSDTSSHSNIAQLSESRIICISMPTVPSKQRQWIVGSASAVLWAASFVALNEAWYTDYHRTSFHYFNDNKEWNQVDKMGHVWTSYQISRVSTEAWRWTHIKDKKAIILGAVSGVAYQTIIEIQDGYSDKWGFSWGDMAANFIGSGIYAAQEFAWKRQRFSIKFSYWPYDYSQDLIERRDQLFGNSHMERILKDYNAQTYWLSANMHSFFPKSRLPKWLNISFGYNSDGMFGGRENKWNDESGNIIERKDIPRLRHYYLAPDIDFTKIHTDSKVVRKLFFLLNAVKFPTPSLEVNSKGKLKVHALTF